MNKGIINAQSKKREKKPNIKCLFISSNGCSKIRYGFHLRKLSMVKSHRRFY